MKNRRNFYRVLHVQPDAPAEIIRASYRALMTKLDKHPDRGGDHETAALINEAYRTLSDESKHRRYDQSLLQAYARGSGRGGPQSPNPSPRPPGQRGAAPNEPYAPAIQHYCPFCMTPHGYGKKAPPDAECVECHSPLAHAPKMKPLQSGRRATHRVSTDQALTLFTHWPQQQVIQGKLTDLSLDGIQFDCAQSIETNQNVKIESTLLDAVVRTVYCRASEVHPHSYTVGARFLTLRLHKHRGAFLSVET